MRTTCTIPVTPLKEVFKNSSCLGLTECLGKSKSLSNADIEYFLTLFQIFPYGGTTEESCVITRISIFGNQKTKSSMILTLDPDFAIQVIYRVHYQCYYYVHCCQEEISPIIFRS